MPLYEHVLITRQDISPQQVEELTDTFKGVIESQGGSVAKTEYWGLRSLAYRIKKYRKGHYSLMNIDAPSEAIAEMERQERINSDVVRFLTLRMDELEEGPSAMMQTRKDDRRGRGGPPGRDRDRPRNNDRPDRSSHKREEKPVVEEKAS